MDKPQFLEKNESEMTSQELAAKRHHERTNQRRASMQEQKQKRLFPKLKKPSKSVRQLSIVKEGVQKEYSHKIKDELQDKDDEPSEQSMTLEAKDVDPRLEKSFTLSMIMTNELSERSQEAEAQQEQLNEKELAKKRHEERMKQKRASMEPRQPFTMPQKAQEESENEEEEEAVQKEDKNEINDEFENMD